MKLLAVEILTMSSDPAWALRALKRYFHDHPVVWNRRTIDLNRPLGSLAEILWLIFTRIQALWLVLLFGLFFALAMLSLYPSSNPRLSLITIAAPVHMVLSTMLSLTVHEMGHALTWRYISGETQAIVAVSNSSVKVICPAQPLNKEALIAMGGPSANVLLSCASAIATFLFHQHPLLQIALWLFVGIQGVVGVGSLLGSDGRKLWRTISSSETVTPLSKEQGGHRSGLM